MSARRTKKAAPRKPAGARRAKAVATRAPRKAARKARKAAPSRTAAARKAAPKAAPKRKAAAKAAAPKRRVKAAAKRKPAAARKTAPPARRAAVQAAPAPKRAATGAARAAAVRDLERGCDAVLAAIRGLSAEAAERPIAPGKWSPRQILLHMAYWDEWMLGVLPAAITRGRPPEPLTEALVQAANERAVASGAGLPWDDVRSLWATQRELLLGLLAAVPLEPAVRWTREHALGAVLAGYADHDRHHAAQIRNARRSKAPAFTPAFAPQQASASEKERVLFELQRARTAVKAALQGLGGASAMRPVAPGKWSPHEIVLHLVASDEARLEFMSSTLAGEPAAWLADHEPGYWAADNEAAIAPRRGLPWDDAVRLLDATRERLLAALREVPAEPAAPWAAEHPFGALLRELVPHDRHHAEQIKTARISIQEPRET